MDEDYDDIDDEDYKGELMMMMKVMMILSRAGSTGHHLPVAKELDKSLILITHQAKHRWYDRS